MRLEEHASYMGYDLQSFVGGFRFGRLMILGYG